MIGCDAAVMIEFHSIFTVQIFLLCLMLIGVISAKTRIVDEHARSSMTNIILCVFLPCNILYSFFGTERSQLPSLGIMVVISMGIMALGFALSLVLYKRAGPEQKKVLLYATLISNAAFLGIPVIESIYGLEGMPYLAAYLLPLRVVIWAGGLAIFAGGKSNWKQVAFHPCMIATYLGILAMLTGFTPPLLLSRLLSSLGSCTTPISMLVIGSILAMVDFRKIITGLTVYFTFIRLVLIPLLVMGILLIFRPDPMLAGISVILSGMPAGATASILAAKYGGVSELASKIVFLSTLLSIISAPLLLLMVQRFF